jgi:hypothetical protein
MRPPWASAAATAARRGPPLLLPLMVVAAAAAALLALMVVAAQSHGADDTAAVVCDIAIAGGSTASLAAAITAAEAAPELTVCFTEPTDWPGGQMTAGGVPAIDFGGANEMRENQPASFADAMASIPGDGRRWNTFTMAGSGSPGACSVSTKCYLPNNFVTDWIMPRLKKCPNLKVFLRTVVAHTSRGHDGTLASLQLVQRAPRAGTVEWSNRLSNELPDWYSPAPSPAFTKKTITLVAKVFIEGTELGDVLATAGLPFAQGVEAPAENSTHCLNCGQAQTLTFFMELLPKGVHPTPGPVVPPGGGEGFPFPNGSEWADKVAPGKIPGGLPSAYAHGNWRQGWTWRRAHCASNRSLFAVNDGDISQQNSGNDLDSAYLFPSHAAVQAEIKSGWRGGLNLTALRMLEERAFGWFWFLKNSSVYLDPTMPARLVLNTTTSGTAHGLSKMVYWRDTRRAIGVDGFRLTHPPLRDVPGPTGTHFNDSVALGCYNDDTHELRVPSCVYPAYMTGANNAQGAKPFYIPLRAMLVGGAPNLLTTGKTMSQSFHANSNTRLHPSEWTSGVAAGGAAVLMVRNGWTSSDALEHIEQVQSFLNSSAVGSPRVWSGIGSGYVDSVCGLGKCFGVEPSCHWASCASFNLSDCGVDPSKIPSCRPLAENEWLANADFWTRNATAVDELIFAVQATWLKKSTTSSGNLPPSEKMRTPAGFPCRLLSPKPWGGYWLCSAAAGAASTELSLLASIM